MTSAHNIAPIEIGQWDAEQCIGFLERDGAPAPEYDLEADGLGLLRRDCRERLSNIPAAA